MTPQDVEATCRSLERMAAQWDRCAANSPGPSLLRGDPADTYRRYARLCRERIAELRKDRS